jgi:integrase
VLRDYLEQRRLKPGTAAEYTRAVETAFADWRTRPLNTITRDAVLRRFKKLHDEHGPAWANLTMRILRALFNYAAHKYADEEGQSPFAANPVRVLSQTRGWAKVERRRGTIKPHEMPAWYASVQELTNTTVRDYLLLLIFTGLRRREAARLRWQDVDLKVSTLTVADTKNGRPHTLPLPRFILSMLNDRFAGAKGAFVFEGTGAAGYLDSPRKAKAKVVEASGVSFTLHDLRRTFATVAESLDITGYTLKRLLNHGDGSDVTAGYVNASVDRLREPMEKVANYLASAMGIDGRVTPLDVARLHATR